ncbi:hypothetical protein FWF74_01190 [Candidatus Saccharibacteria bacterium]|nr:hypothetical protein [Candidatus Saccharibacteria bacterium]MCL1963210.1 hypothetical protein [Candidatus Saccharibacteria bacterium]
MRKISRFLIGATLALGVVGLALPAATTIAAELPAGTLIDSVSISPTDPTWENEVTLTVITTGGEQECSFGVSAEYEVGGFAGIGVIPATNSALNTWTAPFTMLAKNASDYLTEMTIFAICSDFSDDYEVQDVVTFTGEILDENAPIVDPDPEPDPEPTAPNRPTATGGKAAPNAGAVIEDKKRVEIMAATSALIAGVLAVMFVKHKKTNE